MKIKPVTLLLAVSLVANVVLAALWYFDEVSGLKAALAPKAERVAAQAAGLAKLALSDAEIRQYYDQQIASLQIPEEDKKRLLLAWLEERYRVLAEGEYAAAYWQAPSPGGHEVPERVRTDLISLFGAKASSDPLFARYFRPLDAQFPFLSPEKQVQVAQLLAQGRAEAHRLAQSEELINQAEAMQKARSATEENIRALLTPEEYSEFELRESPLADAIRRLNLDLAEHEYRQLFASINTNPQLKAIVTRTSGAQRPSGELYDNGIAELLGHDRYLKFLRQVDPLYLVMAGASRDQKIAPEIVTAAYENTVARLGKIRQLQRQGDREAARAELARHRDELSGAFGPGLGMMLAGMIDSSLRI
jgi:hypothetical protein